MPNLNPCLLYTSRHEPEIVHLLLVIEIEVISYADRQSFDIRDILRKTERLAETGPFVGNRLTIHPDDTGAGVSVEIAFFVRRCV